MKPALETVAAAIYSAVAEVLEIERVRPEDNFIELGGNSLLAVILANMMEDEFGTRPELTDIFSLELGEFAGHFHDAL
jgi:acyl carrier protein